MIGDRTHAVLIEDEDLTRPDVADKLRTDRVQGAAFGGDNITTIRGLAIAKRTKTVRIAYRDEFRRRQDDQRVGAFDTPHRLINRLFDGRRLEPFLGDDIGNDLGIARG